MKLREKVYKKNKIYIGKAVDFCNDEIILPNGKKATREYIYHPGAVAVVPFLDKTDIILVRQYRYPIDEITYEIPAWKLDIGKKESSLECAKRELKEETGYSAKTIKKLISFWPSSAFSNEKLVIYVARNLIQGKANPDNDEFIKNLVLPFKKALQMVKQGKIKDSKTIIALLYIASKI